MSTITPAQVGHPVSTPREVAEALARPGGLVVDVRSLHSSEATANGDGVATYAATLGALSAPWDKVNKTMPVGALPADKSTPLILHCRGGVRAQAAADFLAERGYADLTNAGGPAGPSEQWALLCKSRGVHDHVVKGMLQLFDGPAPAGGGSSTYTYLLWDEATKEALLIDPVLEQVERDISEVERLGLHLIAAINTHCHADHITSTGVLKKRLHANTPGFKSCISKASGAMADVLLEPGETFGWAGGNRGLKILATPGHTNGCISLYGTFAP